MHRRVSQNDAGPAGTGDTPRLDEAGRRVDFLRSPAAAAALAELAGADLSDAQTLVILDRLRRTFAPQEAAALLTQARLRRKAGSKFPLAGQMFFAEEALEQATAWPVALHRAGRLHALSPPGAILDLGSGMGGDLLAFAQYRPVTGFELDAERAEFARANVAVAAACGGLPFRASVESADWVAALDAGTLPPAAAAFADPARRREGRRVFTLEGMEPPLSALLRLQKRIPALAVKVAPGVSDADLPAGAAVEFVSHEGVCKEAVLWFGPLAPADGPARWASVHDGAQWHTLPSHGDPPPLGAIEPGQILYEPDPAVIRAGALAGLCADLSAFLFEPSIAYLAAAEPRPTPFARAFAVRELFPFSLKRLNARLRELGIGRAEIKKRGFPVEPEDLRPRLKLAPQGPPLTVILTRRGDDHWVILCDRLESA